MHKKADHNKGALTDILIRTAQRKTNLAVAAQAGSKTFQEWVHYPSGDAHDREHQTMFYYHAHAKHERDADEHGHFHVFATDLGSHAFYHLVAISLDPKGLPYRLFLTNRWVTGETWLTHKQIKPHLRDFQCVVAGRLSPVARFITHLVGLYEPEIHTLHQERERWFKNRKSKNNYCVDLLEDQTQHVVAQTKIDLMERLR